MTIIVPRRDETALTGTALSLRYQQYLESITVTTNTNETQVNLNTSSIATNTANIGINTSAISVLDAAVGDLIVTGVSRVTTGTARIICTASITITLNASPGDDEKVYVKETNGQVVINGNGNTIDGAASVTIDRPYTCLLLCYSTLVGAWFVI